MLSMTDSLLYVYIEFKFYIEDTSLVQGTYIIQKTLETPE